MGNKKKEKRKKKKKTKKENDTVTMPIEQSYIRCVKLLLYCTATPARKNLEREFVFDCEERMLAELNELDVEDASPGARKKKVPVAEAEALAVPRKCFFFIYI